jgi:hypothetical protein
MLKKYQGAKVVQKNVEMHEERSWYVALFMCG